MESKFDLNRKDWMSHNVSDREPDEAHFDNWYYNYKDHQAFDTTDVQRRINAWGQQLFAELIADLPDYFDYNTIKKDALRIKGSALDKADKKAIEIIIKKAQKIKLERQVDLAERSVWARNLKDELIHNRPVFFDYRKIKEDAKRFKGSALDEADKKVIENIVQEVRERGPAVIGGKRTKRKSRRRKTKRKRRRKTKRKRMTKRKRIKRKRRTKRR